MPSTASDATHSHPKRRAWSVQEVADQIGVPKAQVYALIHSGQLGAFKVGHMYRVPDRELDRLFESATKKSA